MKGQWIVFPFTFGSAVELVNVNHYCKYPIEISKLNTPEKPDTNKLRTINKFWGKHNLQTGRRKKMLDDIIFFSSLLLCISLGGYYKKIEDADLKRNYGAGLGILVACLLCGHYIYHTILMTMALRLVGLASEMYVANKGKPEGKTSSVKISSVDNDINMEPTAVDIISYAYFFIGFHKGPYYRWKIFNDHFTTPFGVLGDCRIITEQKLKKAFICGIGYSLLRMKYSPEIYYDGDFYIEYGTDFRYLYNIPQLIMYFLHFQIVMMLCTSVATETGFGVFPAKCLPLPGYGPSAHFSLLKLAAATPDIAMQQEYNFSMLKCYENEKLLIGPRMKDTMRSWDMPTQYWFWAYVYKNMTKANHEVRSALSFLAWTIWSGPSLQQIIISATLWVYVHLEAEYADLYDTTGALKLPWDIGFSIMRLFCLIYLTPCLIISDTDVVLRYYNSIFWVYHMVLLVLTIGAVVVYKSRDE
ncbi:hypothetical protein O3G_MSEX009818 [Manduca sexta]|uniref:Lysophospholipid acyltransferase 7 n=1 Tax=Manduca sexta TaxID=7130 RepID=A0A921ZFE9_MANSE|nr:hypothetical protein O3G_MSEX009818 [Manduca sexta]